MFRVYIDGIMQDGIPTPRLIEAGGGKAYRKGNIWYLWVDGSYESDNGEFFYVTIVNSEA
jgi:hypothetical protein